MNGLTDCAQKRVRTLGCRCSYCTGNGPLADGEALHVPIALCDRWPEMLAFDFRRSGDELNSAIQRREAAYDDHRNRVQHAWQVSHERGEEARTRGRDCYLQHLRDAWRRSSDWT